MKLAEPTCLKLQPSFKEGLLRFTQQKGIRALSLQNKGVTKVPKMRIETQTAKTYLSLFGARVEILEEEHKS